MHRGDPMRELARDFPRPDLNLLPRYAPELNPVEQRWNFAKDKELSNFVPPRRRGGERGRHDVDGRHTP